MGLPTSEVGCTPAIPWREDHEVHKDMWWWHWKKKKNLIPRRNERDIIKKFYTTGLHVIVVRYNGT